MKFDLLGLFCAATIGSSVTMVAYGAGPIVPYTGRLVEGGMNVSGNRLVRLALVDPEGTVVWSNAPLADGVPSAAISVLVSQGSYQVEIGNTTLPDMAALDPSVLASGSDLKLRVWISQEVGQPILLTPDLPVRHAFQAVRAEMLGNRSATEVFQQIDANQAGLSILSTSFDTEKNQTESSLAELGNRIVLEGYQNLVLNEQQQSQIARIETVLTPDGTVNASALNVSGSTNFSGDVSVNGGLHSDYLQTNYLDARSIQVYGPWGGTRLDGFFNEIGGMETRFRGESVRFETMMPVDFHSGIRTWGPVSVESDLTVTGTSNLSGSLNVEGNAHFSGAVEVPAPQSGVQATNRDYVDQKSAELSDRISVDEYQTSDAIQQLQQTIQQQQQMIQQQQQMIQQLDARLQVLEYPAN